MKLRTLLTLTVLAGALLVLATACEEQEKAELTPTATVKARATDAPQPPAPTGTPLPPQPTSTPVPPPTSTPKPSVIILEGVGQTATEPVTPPASVSRAIFTHNGSSNFAVWAFQGDKKDLLINEIGSYQGQRPIFGQEPVFFDIDADGAWTLRIEPVGTQGSPAFSGRGDAVSGMFSPPSGPSPWTITHTGESNFAVWLHCSGGSDLIQNEIGRVAGSRVIQFEDGPCLWEVEADGEWSLAPR